VVVVEVVAVVVGAAVVEEPSAGGVGDVSAVAPGEQAVAIRAMATSALRTPRYYGGLVPRTRHDRPEATGGRSSARVGAASSSPGWGGAAAVARSAAARAAFPAG
jgi:hypothetical protein